MSCFGNSKEDRFYEDQLDSYTDPVEERECTWVFEDEVDAGWEEEYEEYLKWLEGK